MQFLVTLLCSFFNPLVWFSGSVLDYKLLSPVFESWWEHIWRLFQFSLRFITFAGRSAHLAYQVHKSGRKTLVIIIILDPLCMNYYFLCYFVLYFIFKYSLITSTITRRKFLIRLWTWPIIYYWMNYELLIIIYLYCVRVWNTYLLSLLPPWSNWQGALNHRLLQPEFESRRGHSWFSSLTLFHYIWRSFAPFSLRRAQKWP